MKSLEKNSILKLFLEVKINILLKISIFIFFIINLSACVFNSKIVKIDSSSMIRTIGLGETALPLEKNNHSLEFFNSPAISVDRVKYTEIDYADNENQEDEYILSNDETNSKLRYYGFNYRVGFDNFTELKLGLYRGRVREENIRVYGTTYKSTNTDIYGFQIGLKRLLSELNNPHKITFNTDFLYMKTNSNSEVEQYDGYILECKPALIYGYIKNNSNRSFPSLALFYSYTNTHRDNTLENLPLSNEFLAVGGESIFSLHLGHINPSLIVGAEKLLSEHSDNDFNFYFSLKVQFLLNYRK